MSMKIQNIKYRSTVSLFFSPVPINCFSWRHALYNLLYKEPMCIWSNHPSRSLKGSQQKKKHKRLGLTYRRRWKGEKKIASSKGSFSNEISAPRLANCPSTRASSTWFSRVPLSLAAAIRDQEGKTVSPIHGRARTKLETPPPGSRQSPLLRVYDLRSLPELEKTRKTSRNLSASALFSENFAQASPACNSYVITLGVELVVSGEG